MTEDEDIDGLAAEYVLGSLDPAERAQVDARRQADAALTAAIAAWERRLAPLSDVGGDVTPPAHIFDGILSRISGQAAQLADTGTVVPLQRASNRRWKIAAGAGVLAACLALAVGWFTWFNHVQPGPELHARMDCNGLYKDFWLKRDSQTYARLSPEQLAGVSRMALRAYDACTAGDDQDAKALFDRLGRMNF
jgi:anti-sigma-K factor RskA